MTGATDGRSDSMTSSKAATFVTNENPRDYFTVYDNVRGMGSSEGHSRMPIGRSIENQVPAVVAHVGMLRLRRSSASLHSGSAQHDIFPGCAEDRPQYLLNRSRVLRATY